MRISRSLDACKESCSLKDLNSEPTSGLDSQTSWSIMDLLEKLTQKGQAILCTVHQPSAMLFQRFDRLLLLAKGGKTVYFGDIGKDSNTMVSLTPSQSWQWLSFLTPTL